MAGGRAAAELAVRSALRRGAVEDPHDAMAWCRILADVDAELESMGGGETTLVVATLSQGCLVGASVGDSVAWICGDAFRDLTRSQHRKPLLGSGAAFPVSFQSAPLRSTLLLASDGLWKYGPQAAIQQAAAGGDLQDAVERLVELVRLPSGSLQDDVGILLCRLASGAWG
jgi:PPM family protein phosphatase